MAHQVQNEPDIPDEFSQQIEGLRPRLAGFFRQRIKVVADTDDLVQMTLSAAYLGRAKYRGTVGDRRGERWVFGIAANLLKKYLRDRGIQESHTYSFEVQHEAGWPEPSVYMEIPTESPEYAQRLLGYLKQCCTDYEQEVLTLFYTGKEFIEIAELLQIGDGSVRSYFRRGRMKLLAYLVEHDIDSLGGAEEVRRAWEEVCSQTGGEEPTLDEKRAWEKRKPVEKFRLACLKMARYLKAPY
ncbi:RNA polymerase sigma factor [Armatimonas sp.]|uniref:RNA polymerase sigma factor n=1 Tax=Armatimonas sp. TaxID=1872638 RepID=UPI0037512E64